MLGQKYKSSLIFGGISVVSYNTTISIIIISLFKSSSLPEVKTYRSKLAKLYNTCPYSAHLWNLFHLDNFYFLPFFMTPTVLLPILIFNFSRNWICLFISLFSYFNFFCTYYNGIWQPPTLSSHPGASCLFHGDNFFDLVNLSFLNICFLNVLAC